ncbi:2192_t:CDS:10 [Ambispora leptoticha]|uniref:2192_t:CDS:1 n=1 Tax=Ambispora leptoticha TaxID=144679 RepID=A0A9N9AG21_9GLOM|nr:2192_t:CDS:10 [Ambispora leptoticha]
MQQEEIKAGFQSDATGFMGILTNNVMPTTERFDNSLRNSVTDSMTTRKLSVKPVLSINVLTCLMCMAQEHMMYRKALDSFPKNHKQAQECIQEKIEKSSESVEAFWTSIEKNLYEDQINIARADGILHMFKATNQSQQYVTNIQHQDLRSLYPYRILKKKDRNGYTTPCPITNSLEDNPADESRSKRRILAKTDDDSYKSDEHDERGDSDEASDENSDEESESGLVLNTEIIGFDDFIEQAGKSFTFKAKNISSLFKSYRSEALSLAQESDDYSDVQIKKFSRDTLEDLRKDTRSKILGKEKLSKDIKSILQEYVEIALDDEDGGLSRLRKLIIESYSKTFNTPEELELFQKMRLLFQQLASNIPIHSSKEKISEGTLIANIISPVLRIFFHDVSVHPTIWPNTSSSSAKVRKLANNDPPRAKQPNMIGNNVLHNGRFAYEMMYGEVTGEDNILQKTGVNSIVFAWQSIVTKWTGYFMTLIAPGVYIMVDAAYERASKKVLSAINKDEDSENVGLKTWCRPTLGTSEFKKITEIK